MIIILIRRLHFMRSFNHGSLSWVAYECIIYLYASYCIWLLHQKMKYTALIIFFVGSNSYIHLMCIARLSMDKSGLDYSSRAYSHWYIWHIHFRMTFTLFILFLYRFIIIDCYIWHTHHRMKFASTTFLFVGASLCPRKRGNISLIRILHHRLYNWL